MFEDNPPRYQYKTQHRQGFAGVVVDFVMTFLLLSAGLGYLGILSGHPPESISRQELLWVVLGVAVAAAVVAAIRARRRGSQSDGAIDEPSR